MQAKNGLSSPMPEHTELTFESLAIQFDMENEALRKHYQMLVNRIDRLGQYTASVYNYSPAAPLMPEPKKSKEPNCAMEVLSSKCNTINCVSEDFHNEIDRLSRIVEFLESRVEHPKEKPSQAC